MSNSSLVYSTAGGSYCPECGNPVASCSCPKGKKAKRNQAQQVPKDGIVRVGRETKGRKGKGVTIVTGVPLGGQPLKDLAKKLKQRCGSGGTVKGNIIEIQGDHRDTLVAVLQKEGYTVKKSGG